MTDNPRTALIAARAAVRAEYPDMPDADVAEVAWMRRSRRSRDLEAEHDLERYYNCDRCDAHDPYIKPMGARFGFLCNKCVEVVYR